VGAAISQPVESELGLTILEGTLWDVGALALATTVAGKAPTELYATKTERVTWRFPVEPEDP
jgi:hypothetical protein